MRVHGACVKQHPNPIVSHTIARRDTACEQQQTRVAVQPVYLSLVMVCNVDGRRVWQELGVRVIPSHDLRNEYG